MTPRRFLVAWAVASTVTGLALARCIAPRRREGRLDRGATPDSYSAGPPLGPPG
jgi:hypothetical protein